MQKSWKTTTLIPLAVLMLTAPSLYGAETGTGTDKPGAPAATSSTTGGDAKPAEAKKGETVKIGYLEMNRFGGETTAGKAARAKLEEKGEALREQVESKQKQLEKQKAALQEKLPSMTQKQREAKAKEFDKKVSEYQKLLQKAEKELQSLEEDYTRKLFREIEKSAASYGKVNGYAAITVKKDLLYMGNNVETQDVTDDIIKMLNAAETKP